MPLKILSQLYSTKNKSKKSKKNQQSVNSYTTNEENSLAVDSKDAPIKTQSTSSIKFSPIISKKSRKTKKTKKEEEEIPVNFCDISSSDSSDSDLIQKLKGKKQGEISSDEEADEFQYEISQLPVMVSASLRQSSPNPSNSVIMANNNKVISGDSPNSNIKSEKSEEFEADSEEDSHDLNDTHHNVANIPNIIITPNVQSNNDNNITDRDTSPSVNILNFINNSNNNNNTGTVSPKSNLKINFKYASDSLLNDNGVDTNGKNIFVSNSTSKLENYKERRKLSIETSNRANHSPSLFNSAQIPNHNYFEEDNEKMEKNEIISAKKIQWQMGGLLGSGSYGHVRMGLNTENGELMAVKQVPIPVLESTSTELVSLQQEIEILRSLNHKHIVRYLGTSIEENMLNIFLECVPGGSLHSLLAKMGPFNEEIIVKYTKQILRGLEYLHSHSIIHRDIKGANILVDSRGVIKLADFGASKKIEGVVNSLKGQSSLKGTSYWMAPEIARQQSVTTKSDIWSLGCTVVEMATGKPPFCEFSDQVSALFHIASLKQRPTFDLPLSSLALNFIKKCFHLNPDKRPSATELLKHPFIASKNGNSYSSPDYRQAGLDLGSNIKTTFSGSLTSSGEKKNASYSQHSNLGKGYAQPVASPFMYLRKSTEQITANINQERRSQTNDMEAPTKSNSHSRKPSESKKKFKFFD